MTRPTVLITNDDGIEAPGLRSLWLSLKEHCDVYIVAPRKEQSGVGASVTLHTPIHIEKTSWDEESPAWSVLGTPADCVRMATRILLSKQPDIVVSGINRGSNAGRNIFFSGTVGGIIDSVTRNIPGIAFSCEDIDEPNYECFTSEIFPLVSYLLKHPLESGSFLNVTFPSKYKTEHKGCYLARQGLSYYAEDPRKEPHPEGKDLYWMGGAFVSHEEHAESDIQLLSEGYITVVPVSIKELTDHPTLHQRKELFNRLFQPSRQLLT